MLDHLLMEGREAWDRLRWGWGDSPSLESEYSQVALVGLPGAGKKTLFRSLLGWNLPQQATPVEAETSLRKLTHNYGLFSLMDAPLDAYDVDEALFQLENADLVVYVLDVARGLSNDDLHWITRLRSRRAPLLVVLNKIDLLGIEVQRVRAEIEAQLSMSVLPLSAQSQADVQTTFAAALIHLCPKLTVPLASQIKSVRHEAAIRLIRQSTGLSLIASMEPIPVLDVSVLIGLQVHLLSRIGALYGQNIPDQSHWAIVSTVAFGLALRYLAETILKFVPYGGWLVSGIIGASGTWALGQAALAFYESNGMPQHWSKLLMEQLEHALRRHRIE